MAFGIKIPIVDDIIEEGEKVVETIVDTMVDTANSVGDLFVGGVVSFGQAASDVGEAVGEVGEDVVLEIVEIGGRVIRTIDDGFEGLSEDITDTAEGIAWLADRAAEETERAAEAVVDTAADVAEAAAETAIDAGMWTWEAADYVQDKIAGFNSDLVDLGGAVTGEVLHPILDPILGENTTTDLLEAGVQFGQIYATGGEAGLREFVNQQVAAEAGSVERRLVAEALGEDAGVAAGTVTHYGLLRAQGMDAMRAAQAVGIDPTSETAAIIEDGTRDLIGDDGAAAASQFARDLMTTYGQQASDIANRSGLEQYGDRFDPSNPGAAMTPHDPGWVTTRGQVELLTQSGERAAGELTEALYEPIVGQEAAEAMGEYGPRIGMEVFRTIASGGMSSGEAALAAGRIGFQAATGQEFEEFVGDSVSREFSGVLGEDGARAFGQLTETGLRLGLNYAGAHAGGDLPDQHVTDIDLDDFKEALVDFGVEQFRDLTGIDPNVANRLILHAGNDTWTEQDSRDLLATIRPFVPEGSRDIYDAAVAASNDDPKGALEALKGRLPEEIRNAYDQQSAADAAMTAVLGYDPNGQTSVLDRMGVTNDDLNDLLARDEEARGVTPYEPPDGPRAPLPAEAESAFASLTAGLNVDPTDPAAPLVAQAVALQDTISLLAAEGGPGAAVAIGQARAMLADLDRQVDLLHDTGPAPASATTALVSQQAMMAAATDSLRALAAQGGPAGIAAQQAQALVAQAERAFVENAGDPDAVVATQQQLLGAAMSVVQSASVGAPFGQAGAISAAANQTAGYLAAAQAHTAAAHGLAPPPAGAEETALANQMQAMSQASQVLGALSTNPMAAAQAQHAQALVTHAQAVAADPGADPAEVVAAQQAALAQAQAVLHGTAAQSAALGDVNAAAVSQQAAALLAEAQSQTATAHGVVPPPPDPYAIIASQNAALQASLAAMAAQSAVTDPRGAMAAQHALGMVGQTQGRMAEVQAELSQAHARAELEPPDPMEARAIDDDALAAARAKAQLPPVSDEAVDPRAAARAPAVVSDDLEAAMAAQHQAVIATLNAMQFQGPAATAAATQAQAVLADTDARIAAAAEAGHPIAPDAELALRQQALGQALQAVGATGAPGAAASQQLQTLLAQTQQATAQIRGAHDDPRSMATGGDVGGDVGGDEQRQAHAVVDDDLQASIAAQHQAVNQSLQVLAAQGPAGAMASAQAQATLMSAQAQVSAIAAQNPAAFTPEQALAIQQQALGQALQLVVGSGAPGASGTAAQIQTLMGQTQQAATQMADAQAAAAAHRAPAPTEPAADPFEDAALHRRTEPTPDPPDDAALHRRAEPRSGAGSADDDFDDDILAAHLPRSGGGAGAPAPEVPGDLAPDGDGQPDSGVAPPQPPTTATDDPLADLAWQDTGGDVLLGDEPASTAGPATATPLLPDGDAVPADTADLAPPPAEEPLPVVEVPEPVPPVEPPEALPDPVAADAPDLPPEPEPEPEPIEAPDEPSIDLDAPDDDWMG